MQTARLHLFAVHNSIWTVRCRQILWNLGGNHNLINYIVYTTIYDLGNIEWHFAMYENSSVWTHVYKHTLLGCILWAYTTNMTSSHKCMFFVFAVVAEKKNISCPRTSINQCRWTQYFSMFNILWNLIRISYKDAVRENCLDVWTFYPCCCWHTCSTIA